jgi:hypothetical protein
MRKLKAEMDVDFVRIFVIVDSNADDHVSMPYELTVHEPSPSQA